MASSLSMRWVWTLLQLGPLVEGGPTGWRGKCMGRRNRGEHRDSFHYGWGLCPMCYGDRGPEGRRDRRRCPEAWTKGHPRSPHQASPLCPTLSLAHLNHDGWEATGPVMPFPIPVPAYLPILPPDQLPEHRVVRPGGECAGPTAYHLQAPQ